MRYSCGSTEPDTSTANANARAAKFHGSARENGVKKLEINEGVKLYLDGLDDPGAATIEQMQNATGLSAGAVSKHRKRYINQ